MSALIAGSAYFIFVFFKAVQQRNVAFLHYRWVIPTSCIMATTEVIMISAVAIEAIEAHSWIQLVPFLLSLGIGGGLGAMCAMWFHTRFIGKKR